MSLHRKIIHDSDCDTPSPPPAVVDRCSRSPLKRSCKHEEGVVIMLSSDSEKNAEALPVDEFGNPQEDTPPKATVAAQLAIHLRSRSATADDEVTMRVDTDNLAWRQILLAIPLSEHMFIAGGAATWLAERATFRTDPDWTPDDVDVFICQREDMFVTIVLALMQSYINIPGAYVVRRLGIIDVKMVNNPHLSFIRCAANANARAVVAQFDIDICRPIVMKSEGEIVVKMTADVEAGIRNRHMQGHIPKQQQPMLQYPLAKTLHRLSKYQSRGYNLVSLTFHSVMNMDYPDRECMLHADDFYSLVMMASNHSKSE